jgi:hypothetical protein
MDRRLSVVSVVFNFPDFFSLIDRWNDSTRPTAGGELNQSERKEGRKEGCISKELFYERPSRRWSYTAPSQGPAV